MIDRHMHLSVTDDPIDKQWTTDSIIIVGEFLKNNDATIFLSMNNLLNRRIMALTGILALGTDDMFYLIDDLITKNDIKTKRLNRLNINIDHVLMLNSTPEIILDGHKIYQMPYKSELSDRILDKYRINFLITNSEIQKYEYTSNFIRSATKCSPRIYDNNIKTVWYLN